MTNTGDVVGIQNLFVDTESKDCDIFWKVLVLNFG